MINSFVAIDLETTGVDPSVDKIIEIGAIKVIDGVEQGVFSSFVNPGMPVPWRITEITGIDDSMVVMAPSIEEVLPQVLEFVGDLPLLGHNIKFDYSFLKSAALNCGAGFEKEGIDTLRIARILAPELESKRLEFLCGHYGIDAGQSHRAFDDARSAMRLYEVLGAMENATEDTLRAVKLEFKPKKKSPITAAQLKYLNALVEKYHIQLPADPETLTKSEASRKIDEIITTYGR